MYNSYVVAAGKGQLSQAVKSEGFCASALLVTKGGEAAGCRIW